MNAVIPQDLLQAVSKITGTNDSNAFYGVLKSTVMPDNTSDAQTTAFLMVAKEYNLNPITKEIYAFPAKGGGIQPIVSIDGWLKIINSHPQFDGMEFVDDKDANNNLISVTCRIFRKDRTRSVEVTEYLSECKKNTEPWTKWPARMLRHKATIQAARYAFGFSGIVDEDEAFRIAPSNDDIKVNANNGLLSAEKIAEVNGLMKSTNADEIGFLSWVCAESVESMTEAQYNKAITGLKKKQADQEQKNEQIVEADFVEVQQGEEISLS